VVGIGNDSPGETHRGWDAEELQGLVDTCLNGLVRGESGSFAL